MGPLSADPPATDPPTPAPPAMPAMHATSR
jgi:hypothetical protein